jgi:hypothetical protein
MNLPTRFPEAKVLMALLCLLGCVVGFSAQPALSSSQREVRVHADGSLTGVADAIGCSAPGRTSTNTTRYSFGLPEGPPQRRWLEADHLPICHTQWETNGVRYLQTVMLTRLEEGDLSATQVGSVDSVLLVRIMGESLTNQYASAEAALAIHEGECATRLELTNLVVYARPDKLPIPFAVLDISPSGIDTTAGTQLHFRGNIPPATSGSMVIKIPAVQVRDEPTLNRLLDLDFERELQRVKQYWRSVPTGELSYPPVQLVIRAPTQ